MFKFKNISKVDIKNNNSKKTILFINDTGEIIYIDNKLNKHNLSNAKIINEKELDKLRFPNYMFIIEKGNDKCEIYVYDDHVRKHSKLSTDNHILKVIKSQNIALVSTLSNNEISGIAPLTITDQIMTMDGKRNAEDIINDPLNKYIGKYETKIRYIEILNPTIRVYSIPAPIPNLTIKETSLFLMFIGDEQIPQENYRVLDNDYQIEFNEHVELTVGLRIMCVFSYHRAVDLSNIKIAHGNLNDEMGIEWENAQRHLINYNNPHRTHKTHVGLSQVQNYPIANNSEAELGESDERYMTPLKTKLLIRKLISEGYIEYSSYLIKRTTWTYLYTNPSVTKYTIPSEYYDPELDNLDIYMYGLWLEKGTDYNIVGRDITLLVKIEENAPLQHIIEKVIPNDQERVPVHMLKSVFKWTATEGSQDAFALPLSIYTRSCRVELFLEGVKMAETDNYTMEDNIVKIVDPVDIGQSIYAYIYETELNWSDIRNRPLAIDNLNSDSTVDYLTARQGKILSNKIGRSLNEFRVSGNREIIKNEDNKTITEIYKGETLLVREEITEENGIQNINTYFMDNSRGIETVSIKITNKDDTVIKEYL